MSLSSQQPLSIFRPNNLDMIRLLRQRKVAGGYGYRFIHKADPYSDAPERLVHGREHAPGTDHGNGRSKVWYFSYQARCHVSSQGGSTSTRQRAVRGDGEEGWLWRTEAGKKLVLDAGGCLIGYTRTLYYVRKIKNNSPAGPTTSYERLGWSMVEFWLKQDPQDADGADQQLVLCKLYRTNRKHPETAMLSGSSQRSVSGDDSMPVQAAELVVDPVAGRCGISEANTDDQQGHAEVGEKGGASLDGANLVTLCRPGGENPNRARELEGGNAATMKAAVVDEPRSGLAVVMKFGGSSINSAERIKEMANLVLGFPARAGEIPVVVLSAMGDTATNILNAAEKAASCGEQKVCEIVELAVIKELHIRTIDELGVHIVHPAISDLLDQLEKNLMYAAMEKRLTPVAIWRLVSLGESMSTTIFSAYLNECGKKSRKYDAHAFSVITTSDSSTVDILETTYLAVAKKLHGDWIDGPTIPVVPCFTREACKSGDITPLGSDLTAMIIGKALGSREIQIWEDTDGVLTGDPNICTNAIPVHKLTFDEAIELAYSGHPGLHPQTMLFAIKGGLPVVTIKNTSNPEAPGTTITQTRDMSKTILSSIVLKSNIVMLNIESTRLLSPCDFQAQVFSIFKGSGICVDREATSGGKISLTLHPSKLCGSKLTQREVHNVVEELEKVATVARQHQAIISLVGNVQKSSFILGKAFNTLGRIGVNAQNVWQRSSKVLNVSLVVHDSEAKRCVQVLHSAFLQDGCFLSKVEGEENEECTSPVNSDAGDKRKAVDDHPEAPPGVRPQSTRTDTDRSSVVPEETETQLPLHNNPPTVADVSLNGYYETINNDYVAPVNDGGDLSRWLDTGVLVEGDGCPDPMPPDVEGCLQLPVGVVDDDGDYWAAGIFGGEAGEQQGLFGVNDMWGLAAGVAEDDEQPVEALLAVLTPDQLLGPSSGDMS